MGSVRFGLLTFLAIGFVLLPGAVHAQAACNLPTCIAAPRGATDAGIGCPTLGATKMTADKTGIFGCLLPTAAATAPVWQLEIGASTNAGGGYVTQNMSGSGGGLACLAPNITTNACTCPSGYVPQLISSGTITLTNYPGAGYICVLISATASPQPNGAPSCPTGMVMNGGVCQPVCSAGDVWNGSCCSCTSQSCANGLVGYMQCDYNNPPLCPSGTTFNGVACQQNPCPSGEVYVSQHGCEPCSGEPGDPSCPP
jgi:hypothetical protein